MNEIVVVWAKYKSSPESQGFKIHKEENNLKRIIELKNNSLIECKKDSYLSEECNICKDECCEIFFNNYSGIFEYFDEENNPKKVLVLHKKICEFKQLCDNPQLNNCKQCDGTNVNPEKYDQLFQNLILEIILKLSEHLPFDLISPVSAYVYDETTYSDNKFLKLLLLIQKKDEIKSSLNHILSNPYRKIIEIEELKRFDEVTYVDSEVIIDILTNPHRWIKHSGGCITYNNNKYSPELVLQYTTEESFDTIENRYVKTFLYNLTKVIDECLDILNSLSLKLERYEKYIFDLNDLKNDVEQSLRHRIFEEVGELTQLPLNSQVLIKQTGYREIFNLDRLLRVTLIPTFLEGMQEAFALKRMDTLWELYVMVNIIKAIGELGYKVKEQKWDEGKLEKDTIYDYASFTFDKNEKTVKISYQESVKVGKSGQHSLRPDFLLECGERRITIDAKFMPKENLPTGDLTKYLTSKITKETSSSNENKEKPLSDAVFAACMGESDSNYQAISFTRLFNDDLIIKYLNLKDLIAKFLELDSNQNDELKKIKNNQYIGYIPIELKLEGRLCQTCSKT